jgi:tetratricopeptide (TPR) repeat protein
MLADPAPRPEAHTRNPLRVVFAAFAGSGRGFGLAAALLATATAAAAAAGPVAPARGPWARHAALAARADTLFISGRLAACEALLDSAVAAAAVARDRELDRVARIRRGRLLSLLRRVPQARRDLAIAIADARAARDTLSECRGLAALGLLEAFDPDPSTESARRALALARRARLRDEQAAAWAAIGAADFAAQRPDAAAVAYRRAIALLERSRDWRGAMTAHAGLQRCLIALNDFAGARREHEIILREAVRHGDLVQQADTWHNLGVLEHGGGNPGAAEAYYVRSAALSRSIGWTVRAVSAERNLALLYINIGRVAQSESVLTHVLPEAERLGDWSILGLVYSQLGVAYRQLGRAADAELFGRRAVALSDSVPLVQALQFTSTLMGTLEAEHKLREALELVDAQGMRLDRRLSERIRADLAYQRADLLVRLGRPREAIAGLRARVGDGPPIAGLGGYFAVEARVRLARCYRALGEIDSALAAYRDATARWEVARSGLTDKTWREGLDNIATNFSVPYAALLLDPARGVAAATRVREAFDLLQRFRARTLAERVRGPDAGDAATPEPIDLTTLQSRALRPGEAFLDIYSGPDTTIVFVVTRDRSEASLAVGFGRLGMRLRVLGGLLADPSNAGAETLPEAERSLGADLYGGAGGLLAASQRVFLAAGSLARYPLGALVAPGDREALAVAHEVAIVPSATLLAGWRSQPPARATPGRLLALASTRDAAGHALPAAAREVRQLAQDYDGAEAHVDARWTAEQFVARGFRDVAMLHFATHTSTNAAEPWHSSLQVAEASVAGGGLEAARIARLRVPARLCVMSSCSSLGGRNDNGETLYGLAAAWLAAGVPTVIATQWNADDRALADFTPRFYAHLAQGESAGASLRAALAEVRANPKYAAPYFWQGIVLVGDPETRVQLRPRRGPGPVRHKS